MLTRLRSLGLAIGVLVAACGGSSSSTSSSASSSDGGNGGHGGQSGTSGSSSSSGGHGGTGGVAGDGPEIPLISPTLYSTFFFKDGAAYGCGANANGHLGVNDPFVDVYRKSKELAYPGGTVVRQVAAGGHGGALLDDQGRVYTWGSNLTGEIGDGSIGTPDVNAPVLQPVTDIEGNAFNHVKKLAVGYQFVGSLKEDGSVWVWGLNGNDGTTPAYGVTGKPIPTGDCPWGGPGVESCYALKPNRIAFPQGVILRDIFASDFAMLAIDTDDAVWTWGGYSDLQSKSTSTPVKWTGLPKIRTLSPGRGSAYALDHDGSVWAWGANFGALVKLTDQPKYAQFAGHVAQVAVSGHSVHFLTDTGALWGWGDQQIGEVGSGPTGIDVSSVDASGCLNAGYDYATKDIVESPVKILDDVASVWSSSFSYSVFAIKKDGTYWGWGRNKVFGLCNDPPKNTAGKDCAPNTYAPDAYDVGVPTQIHPFPG
jgi:alpha-tubulin suppressor-like RCC1 family protein